MDIEPSGECNVNLRHPRPSIVATCLPRAATPSNVIAGFKATGIHTFDRNIFTESDFAPGFITDRPLIVEEQSSLQARSQCIQTSEKPSSSSVNKSPSLASESRTSSNEQGVSAGLLQSPGPSGVTSDSQSILYLQAMFVHFKRLHLKP